MREGKKGLWWFGAALGLGACAISFPDYPLEESSKGAGASGATSSGEGGGSGSGGEDACDGACEDYEGCCDGRCVNLGTDPKNCGTCGVTCNARAGEICQSGGGLKPTCANVEWARWPMPDSTTPTHPPLYEDNGDGTVTDLVTGLMWQQAVAPGSYTFSEATAYCRLTLSSEGLGGHHDWRLPSYVELGSLVDFTAADPGPTIDQTAFPDTPGEQFTAFSAAASVVDHAWQVNFASGRGWVVHVQNELRVRCVR
jgi:hypothetical protein